MLGIGPFIMILAYHYMHCNSREMVLLLIRLFPLAFQSRLKRHQSQFSLTKFVVTPSQFSIEPGIHATLTLSKREIQLFPMIDNDTARAVQIFPVVASNDFSARFNVRGGEKDEILVRLDGMEIFDPYHLQDFGGAISIIALGTVRRANLLMGGVRAEFGGKMSGVFVITAKSGNRDEFSANVGFNLINAHALLEGPLSNKGSWLFSARLRGSHPRINAC